MFSISDEKPEIEMNCPGTFIKLVDQHVEITCKVIAKPAARIYWQRDGKNLTSANYYYKFDPLTCNQRIQMYPVLHEHKGTYTCIAYNQYGIANKTCRLFVQGINYFFGQFTEFQ